MSLSQLLSKRAKIIDLSESRFSKVIKNTSESYADLAIKLLSRYSIRSELRNPDLTDLQLLGELRGELVKIFERSEYKSGVSAYLNSFDTVENASIEILEDWSKVPAKILKLTAEKKIAIDNISRRLLNPFEVETNFVLPIQNMMYRSITFGATYQETEAALLEIITGNSAKAGFMERYATQITRDALNQYSGTINQKAVKEFDMDGFRYIGSLIEDSRKTCVDLVNGSGALADLSLGGNSYRVEDVPKIIKLCENNPGWIDGTNEGNFFTNRGGYNCRHDAIPFIILPTEEEEN